MINMYCDKDNDSLILKMGNFLKNRDQYWVLDVRNKEERMIDGIIDGDFWLQLDILYQDPDKLEEFRDKRIVIYCHSGIRSLSAAKFLKENKFEKVQSLEGGIKLYNLKKN